MLEKRYEPGDIEKKWYDFWIGKDYFRAESKSDKPAYAYIFSRQLPGDESGAFQAEITLTRVWINENFIFF